MISILIPIYNGIEYINEAIISIINQTYKEWEVLIGINGHPENSDVYKKAKKYESDKIKIYDFYTIRGKCNTLNKLVTYSKYNYIALLDVDDKWFPEKLQKQVDLLHHNYDVIGTQCIYFGDKNITPPLEKNIINNYVFNQYNTIINSSCLIKKELAYWNPEYESVEDYELWIRLAKQNKVFYNIPETLVYHRIHKNSSFNNSEKQELLLNKLLNR